MSIRRPSFGGPKGEEVGLEVRVVTKLLAARTYLFYVLVYGAEGCLLAIAVIIPTQIRGPFQGLHKFRLK
jgi:hypothetical protein